VHEGGVQRRRQAVSRYFLGASITCSALSRVESKPHIFNIDIHNHISTLSRPARLYVHSRMPPRPNFVSLCRSTSSYFV
jgi:hypothetical protein